MLGQLDRSMRRVLFSIPLQAMKLPLRPWLLWLVRSSLWLWGTLEDGSCTYALRLPPALASPSFEVAVVQVSLCLCRAGWGKPVPSSCEAGKDFFFWLGFGSTQLEED